MYRCHLNFYLVGRRRDIPDIIEKMPPLDRFTHAFSQSEEPERAAAAAADVILADFSDTDARAALEKLLEFKSPQSECILIARQDQLDEVGELLPKLADVWTAPLPDEAVRMHFLRFQESCKLRKDFWETRQFLEATINSVPNLIWYKDKDGIHEKVNDSFCKTVNKTKRQVQGRGHAYIWDVEQDDPACVESERQVMSTRQTIVSEETISTGDGPRTLMTYKSPLYDVDGSVMGTVGIAIDVTRERAYEEEIIRKNQSLEAIFTTMDCGVMCHSLDGSRILSVNKAALNILGYKTLEELLGDGFDTVANSVADEDKERIRDSIRALKKVGDNVSIEYRVRHKNGEELHVMGNVKLVSENGELFYQRFLLDCTAQKLREQRDREEAERRQSELVQALSLDYCLVCFYDLSTGCGFPLRQDNQMGSILGPVFAAGVPIDDSIDRYVGEYVFEEDRDAVREVVSRERLRRELSGKQSCYVNFRMYVDSEPRYYQLKAVHTGEWSQQQGIVLGLRSVDEETRVEMEKRSLLETAVMQANHANKAKSDFLSNMSHDIRTPMNAIVGFTSLALKHIDKKEQVEEYLNKIMTSGNHLLSLINDILDMSRIESGKIHLDEELCNLPEVLHGLQSIIQADVHAKQLDLYIDAADITDEEIYCDKLRLNQVLLNLLSNSIKYTGAGGKVVMRIREKSSSLPGYASYEFRIQDTGIGMSDDFVSHIFEPFERERNSSISGIQGTGLGMAITKNIVDMMNGTIEVRSKQGVGTEFIVCFTFRLPTEQKETHIIEELSNCRALVVDDDFNTCDSVSYMLQQIGLRAEWTLYGKEAVLRTRQAVARNDNYDIYIVDWLIPDMNGIEVARRIRKETGENVPIIVLTAYDWSDIEDEAREAGVTGFCRKPLFMSELKGCLSSIVRKDKACEDSAVSRRRHSGRILLAEDNELNQEIAEAILTEAGFEVEIVSNGLLAVNRLKESQPGYFSLVLMDVQMPVMGGYEATREIRSLDNRELASIPILAMTANAFEEDKMKALKSGMNGHIAKPIDIDALFDALDSALS